MPAINDKINIRSEAVHDILGYVPHWMIRYGNIMLLIIIIMILTLSYLIKYPDTIATQVVITTLNPPEKIIAKGNGKIEALLVNDNMQVEADKALAIIENTASYKDVFMLKGILDSIRLERSNFYFPFDSLSILKLGEITPSFAALQTSYYEYVLNERLNPISNKFRVDEISLVANSERLKIMESQVELSKKEMELKQIDFERSKALFKEGVIAKQEYERKQLDLLQAQKVYGSLNTSISQLREAINISKSKLSGNEIEKIQNEMRIFNNVIQSYYQLKKSINDWETLYVLKSSITGKVSFLAHWSENQQVVSGDQVFTVIPADHIGYIGKIKAPIQNSGKLTVDQKVNIRLDNYPEMEFGMLKGKVKNISLLPDRDGFYHIDVMLPDSLITTYDKSIEFKQEMRGTAEIIVEDLRLSDRLFYRLIHLTDN